MSLLRSKGDGMLEGWGSRGEGQEAYCLYSIEFNCPCALL